MKKLSGLKSYTDKTKGAVMKLFKKNQEEDFDIGVGSIIKDETAAIISKFGSVKNDYDDIAVKPTPGTSATKTEQNTATPIQPKQTAVSESSIEFGIKDAINLVNSLPAGNPEIVIPVVIKTLESANIHLEDIIEDADKQEKLLETRSMRLISKIEILESKVAAMNDRVLQLNESIEEISLVKHMLTLPSELDEEDFTEEELAEAEKELTEDILIEEVSSIHTNISQEDVDILADEIRNDLNGEFKSVPK